MIYFFKSSYIRLNVEKNYDNVTVKEKYPVFFFSYFVLFCCLVLLHYFVCLEGFLCICLVLGVVGERVGFCGRL